MATYRDLMEENMTYPREAHTASGGKAAALFVNAYAMDLANGDGQQTPEVAKLYSDAFDAGSIEAGVNLMRILIHVSFSTAKDNISCPELKNRLTHLSEKLSALGNPIVPYYNVLARFVIDSPDTGCMDMFKLAESGNKYAITFLALVDYLYEDYPDDEDWYGNRPYGSPSDEYPPREY